MLNSNPFFMNDSFEIRTIRFLYIFPNKERIILVSSWLLKAVLEILIVVN